MHLGYGNFRNGRTYSNRPALRAAEQAPKLRLTGMFAVPYPSFATEELFLYGIVAGPRALFSSGHVLFEESLACFGVAPALAF